MTTQTSPSSVPDTEFPDLYKEVLWLYPDIIEMQHTLDISNKRITFDVIIQRELLEAQRSKVKQSILESLGGKGYKCSIHDIRISMNQEHHKAVPYTQQNFLGRLRSLLGI